MEVIAVVIIVIIMIIMNMHIVMFGLNMIRWLVILFKLYDFNMVCWVGHVKLPILTRQC